MGTLRGFPCPPALWLRRAKPAYAYAIMGTLRGFAPPFGPPPAPSHRSLPPSGTSGAPPPPPHPLAPLAPSRSASPCPPALWLRRAKPAYAYAIMGTLRGFAPPFGPPPAPSHRSLPPSGTSGAPPPPPHPLAPLAPSRSASPCPPALWLRRAKPAYAYAIMGTLKQRTSFRGPCDGG